MKTLLLSLSLLLLLVAQSATAGNVTYVYTDPQGTPLAEADATGTITARFDYAPYGAASTASGMSGAPNGPGYTGHVNDPESGFVYMQARYYDPAVGRSLSVDPATPSAGDLFNFNRYDYASNNPVVNMDPDGRCSTSDPFPCEEFGSGDHGGRGTAPPAPAQTSQSSATGGSSKAQQQDKGSSSSVTTNTYSATDRGLRILLVGTVTGGSYSDYNWVQTVTTSNPLPGKPANQPYPDTDPGQKTLFYLNPKEQTQSEAMAKGVGASTVFSDQPSRNFSGTAISWHANLSLVGINKNGSFDKLKSFTYGFTLDAKGVHLDPLRPTQ